MINKTTLMMPRLLRGLAAPMVVCGLLVMASACNGGGEEVLVDDTVREISQEEVSRMVLSLGQFGREFDEFIAEEENGPLTLEDSAERDIDPEAELADLEGFGWEAGHQAFYRRPRAGPDRGGLFQVGSSVALFATDEDAAGYLADLSDEVGENIGKTNGSLTLEKAERFGAAVADEAAGVRFVASLALDDAGGSGEFRFVRLELTLRHGRLLGTVSMLYSGIGRGDEKRLEGRLRDLARKVNQQMAVVLEDGA